MARRSGNLEEAQKAIQVAQEHARRGQAMARRSIGAEVDSAHLSRSASSVAEFAATSVQPQAAARNVYIKLERAEGTDIRVENDAQVLQVLTNLMLNAIDFSPLEATVTLSVERKDATLIFQVQDQGPGVDPDVALGLFSNVQSTRPGGAGIGLPLSRSLAEDNGGSLRLVPSPPGQSGACFELRWPAAPSAAVPPPPGSSRAKILEGVRVLVVEDDVSIASLIELSFEVQGAQVLAITEPEQVDEVLKKHPVFDIALLDLSPIRDHLCDVLSRLHELSPDAPVVLMSGEPTGVPDEAQGRFASWVRKPFDMDQLLHSVAGLLSEAKKA
jgi:CheY-like chemotaxis protein